MQIIKTFAFSGFSLSRTDVVGSWENMFDISGCTDIYLEWELIDPEILNVINSGATNLKELYLKNCDFYTTDDNPVIFKLPKLEELCIDRTPLEEFKLDFSNCESLRHLFIKASTYNPDNIKLPTTDNKIDFYINSTDVRTLKAEEINGKHDKGEQH